METPMTRAHRLGLLLPPLALMLGCRPQSEPMALGLLADRFDGSEWSTPVNLGPVVNSSSVDANAGLSSDGHTLFFVSNRAGGVGNNDIWMSHRQCLACDWEAPVNLGAPINSDAIDGAPTMSEDGRLLFFYSARAGGFGLGDVYVSHRVTAGASIDIYRVAVSNDGDALGPAVLVPELSSPGGFDQKVAVSTDGHELLVSSDRTGGFGNLDIWRFTRQSANDPWSNPTNLGAPISTSALDAQPSLSRDGRTLIFTSNRAGGFGLQDLWMSTRQPGGQ